MDQPESQPLISDRFLINGTLTSVDFCDDGKIRWSDGHTDRCLAVEKEVLGFASEGSRIRIRAIVENGGGLCCVGSRGKLVRKDFVFEIASADSHRLWCQKLREYIDSLGEFSFLWRTLNSASLDVISWYIFYFIFELHFRFGCEKKRNENKKQENLSSNVIFCPICVFR